MEQHWSKDYIEHVRAVHFALIFLCTAGIIIELTPGKPEVSVARQQLDQIWSLSEDWNPTFLQSAVTQNSSLVAAGLPDQPIQLTIGKVTRSFQPVAQGPLAFVALDKPSRPNWQNDCESEDSSHHPRDLSAVLPPPQTIKDFQDIWDSMFNGVTLHQPSWTDLQGEEEGNDNLKVFARVFNEPKKQMQQIAFSFTDDKNPPHLRIYIQCLVPSSVSAIETLLNSDPAVKKPYKLGTHYQLHALLRADKEYEVYFPVKTADSTVDGQALLLHTKNQTWHRGYFKDSFRELYDALQHKDAQHKDLEGLSWREAVKVLADQEERAPSESFEAFGMKLPASLSAYGALLMILGLQWYLWAQLYEFRRKLKARDEMADAAWISLYASLPAQSLAVISMFILPVLAVAALGCRGAKSHVLGLLSWPVSALGFCLSIALAIATYRSMPIAGPKEEGTKSAAAGS